MNWLLFRLRSTVPLLLLAAAWLAFIAIGLYRAETNIEDFFPWLPDDTPARHHYVEFLEQFGADDVLIVSWEGCRLDDPRIGQLRAALLSEESRWVREVNAAAEVIGQLTSPPQKLSRSEAIERIKNILVGPDGATTCLFVQLTAAGMRDRRHSVSRVIAQAEQAVSIPADDLRLGGHPYVGYYSAEQTRNSIIWLSIPVALISTVLAWICLHRRRLMVLVLMCGGLAALTSLAMVPWAGYRVNGLLSALPSLIYVITTSGVIHVVNYSLALRRKDREEGRTTTTLEHAVQVRRRAFLACLLSSASTALGTLSLVWSDFPAIREFGAFGTAGVLLSFAIQLGLLPLLLGWVFPDDASTVHAAAFQSSFARVFEWLLRWRVVVIAVFLLTSAALAWPLFRLEGRFTLDRMFRPQSEFVRNINWLEQNVGAIDATEVLVTFRPAPKNRFFRRAVRIQSLEAALAKAPGVASTFSTVTFLPTMGDTDNLANLYLARIALERHRDQFLGRGHLVQTEGAETWRITLRSKLFGGLPREELMRGVRSAVASVVESRRSMDDRVDVDDPEIVYTGSSEIFYETQHDVLIDFGQSLLLAYVLILALMTLALRSLRAGLLSMLPNVVPCLTVFGLLGWIDRGIDIGMTVAGCIALGIAVDNTAHMLLLYRRHLAESPSRDQPAREAALRLTYNHSATAVFQTSVICGLSMLPYILSAMLYLSRFGMLMSALMGAAMLCDLLLTPALVATRAGRAFDGSTTTKSSH
ncbi:MAG: efflux RND transporter permease subunit [Planctomycetaceae bacterium]